ncbi:unnamed protein product [Tenebrio molitor]|nr:unnamed protein product [Tenebrio molitor]
MSVDQDPIVSTEPSPTSHLEVPHNRRVSIVEGLHGHDNLAFESPRSRKVSANSDHAEFGPVRKKAFCIIRTTPRILVCRDIVVRRRLQLLRFILLTRHVCCTVA